MMAKDKDNSGRGLAAASSVGSDLLKSINEIIKGLDDKNEAVRQLSAGKICEFTGDFNSAEKLYQNALSQQPDLYEAKARLALTFFKRQENQEALRIAVELCATAGKAKFKRLVNSQPFTAFTVLGDALRVEGKTDLATEAYRKATALEPKDNYSTGHLAHLLVTSGNIKEASKLKIDPAGSFGALTSALTLVGNEALLLPSISGLGAFRQFVLDGV
jgi:tetratricopeptide (TPR) repeat protein